MPQVRFGKRSQDNDQDNTVDEEDGRDIEDSGFVEQMLYKVFSSEYEGFESQKRAATMQEPAPTEYSDCSSSTQWMGDAASMSSLSTDCTPSHRFRHEMYHAPTESGQACHQGYHNVYEPSYIQPYVAPTLYASGPPMVMAMPCAAVGPDGQPVGWCSHVAAQPMMMFSQAQPLAMIPSRPSDSVQTSDMQHCVQDHQSCLHPQLSQFGTPDQADASTSSSSACPSKPIRQATSGARTTLMLRNLPEAYSRDIVIDMLRSRGFLERVNFVYLPMNFRTNETFGYAFVNLVSEKAATDCQAEFAGYDDWCLPSEKLCEVGWSDQQGYESHVVRYRNSPVMHESVSDQFRPVLLQDGVRVAFPAPTKKIKPPRTRRIQEAEAEREAVAD